MQASGSQALLPFVFPLAGFLQHGEARLLRINDGEGLGFVGRAEGGEDFADLFFAERAVGQRFTIDRAIDLKTALADFAVPFARLVNVVRHGGGV